MAAMRTHGSTSEAKPAEARKRDPERTRLVIIEAAREEFAENGYDGARTDRIATRTGMSKGVLYHYFSSKDDLFVAVLEDIYQELRSQNEALVLDEFEPVDGIRELIAHTYQYFVDHPEFIVLVNSENLMKAQHLERSESIRNMFTPLSRRLSELISRGQEQGIFRSNVDVVELYISIVGLGYFFLANRWTLGVVFNRDLLGQGAEKVRLQHMTEMVLDYLRNVKSLDGKE
ncbi:TetR family transcriptional regulator [Aminobacter aminovorans]|jgi:AcrR family transcriptional regulator|uniref:HTH-type transcriptional repressor AcnR n=1 Tax=Aminobacter aminovorans TaxID=83263 RepID=A0A381IKG2_AMIAI|nr:TetR/AcrR family transcriptional regulator [Aminobacter aminovorans]TCS24993.1 TetR family transcriptional regulator [Aminobacter aminovorans]SUY28593.1 HTH-type transcriptional repressor AcnR [Aminobacter aminovorans]